MPFKTLALVLAALAAAPLAAQTRIGAGETVTGTLGEGDLRMEDGAPYDTYILRGRPGETLMVRMTSADVDTYLHWGYRDGPSWVEQAGNDDHGDGTDSRLVIHLMEGGDFEYELRAAAFDAEEEGEYQLQVSVLADPVAQRIRPGETIRGVLQEGDYEGGGGFEDHYLVRGSRRDVFTFFAESDDFDTYLEFGHWRDGELDILADDDDGGRDNNSMLVAEMGREPVYHLVVRSFSGDEAGAYTLRMVEGAVARNDDEGGLEEEHDAEVIADSAATDDPAYTLVPILAGEPVIDALREGSPRLHDGSYFMDFTCQARAGERLTITLSADDIDPYLALGTGTAGEFVLLREDDDGGGGWDAQIVHRVTEAGAYTIRVASANPNLTGPFRFLVRSGR